MWPRPENTAKFFYETLLPFLTDTPLSATIHLNALAQSSLPDAQPHKKQLMDKFQVMTAPDKSVLWGARAAGGDPSGAIAAMHTMRFYLWLQGLSAPRIEHITACFRWQVTLSTQAKREKRKREQLGSRGTDEEDDFSYLLLFASLFFFFPCFPPPASCLLLPPLLFDRPPPPSSCAWQSTTCSTSKTRVCAAPRRG